MLINITDFRWCENLTDVDLVVPLHGISASNVDTLITSQYVKVVIKPYIFECALYKPINVEESTLKLSDGAAEFNLKKSSAELWNQLTLDDMKDRKSLLQIKQNAILEHQERVMKRAKANKEMNIRGEKYALEQIMKLENVSREKIRLEKEQASKQAISEFVNVFNKSSQKENELENKITEARRFAKQYITETIDEENNMELNKDIQRLAFIQKPIDLPVRTSSTIEVKFTPRVFPTPERESTKQAEDEWLNRQAEYRRKLLDRVVPNDLSRNELDPIWLRKKGETIVQLFTVICLSQIKV
ncbi:unnamed protein product [Schistosoma spindalis]|nr:unnamed protein product [Schistosoma spindale]